MNPSLCHCILRNWSNLGHSHIFLTFPQQNCQTVVIHLGCPETLSSTSFHVEGNKERSCIYNLFVYFTWSDGWLGGSTQHTSGALCMSPRTSLTPPAHDLLSSTDHLLLHTEEKTSETVASPSTAHKILIIFFIFSCSEPWLLPAKSAFLLHHSFVYYSTILL